MSLVVGQNVTMISLNKKYKGMVYLYFHFVTHYITNFNHETYMIQKLYIRITTSCILSSLKTNNCATFDITT